MEKKAIKFIDKLYRDLYLSEEVKKHTKSKDKYKSIKEYITYLEEIHKKIISHKHIDTLKKMYYDKYVIKEENIPDSYYKHQEEMYLERGQGHIILNEKEKKELNSIIINDQKKSLDIWLDYFLSEYSNYIPFWAKYWAFQGMLKLGSFDKEKGKYTKRSKHTVTKFADLNREALALSIDYLLKYLNKEEISDKELDGLVKGGSFGSIYTYISNKLSSNNTKVTKRRKGKWIKYDRGTDHMTLVKSLQGYNTGWCTAGEETAKSQLDRGDFYVYYTLDENDEYKVPRIAIRMEGDSIGEIRGIAKHQNLESDMEEVLKEKIKDFPDREEYYKKVSDMEKLTKIYKKYQRKEEFSKEELNFLYEIDSKIEGFGHLRDPRIEEILRIRDKRKDIAYTLSLDINEVALDSNDLNENTKYYFDNLYRFCRCEELYKTPEYIRLNLSIDFEKTPKKLILPKKVGGSLMLINLPSLDNVELPDYIGDSFLVTKLKEIKELDLSGNIKGSIQLLYLKKAKRITFHSEECNEIYFPYLEDYNELELPKIVHGDLGLNSLKNFDHLKLPDKVEGCLNLDDLKSCDNLKLPEYVGTLDLNSLESAKGLNLPKKIVHSLNLGKLKSAEDLIISKDLECDLVLLGLKNGKTLKLPQTYKGGLILDGIIDAKDLVLPEYLGGILSLGNLTNSDNLILPKEIGGSLYLGSLKSAKDLKMPDKINGVLQLDSLIDTEGLKFPKETGQLSLHKLEYAKDLILPNIVTDCLILDNLKEVNYLKLPTEVSGSIFLRKLDKAEKIILPNKSDYIYLNKFKNIDSLIFPDKLTYTIICNGFDITPENVDSYRNNKKI